MIEQYASSPEAIIGPDGLRTPESMNAYMERGMVHSLCVIEWGLPMRSLDVAWPHEQPSRVSILWPQTRSTEVSLSQGWPLSARFVRPPWRTHLPLNPVWPGFAINSVVYGALVAALALGPGTIRCARRRRRGECVACGYELAGLAMCPECGRRA